MGVHGYKALQVSLMLFMHACAKLNDTDKKSIVLQFANLEATCS
jgi:hypothetical protein